MIPSDVVTAHAVYSVIPRKYRLSNTFAGSACHSARGGGPGAAAGAGVVRGAGAFAGGGVHNWLNRNVWSCPAAALAAATCGAAPLDGAWARTVAPASAAHAPMTTHNLEAEILI